MEESRIYFDEIGTSFKDVELGKLFGKPCLKIGKKAFACYFMNEIAIKLPKEVRSELLNLEGTSLFDPSQKGRPMKEWVQVPYKYKVKWLPLCEVGRSYVENIG